MKIVFLDRDGVLNRDRRDYVKNLSELEIFQYAPEAVAKLNRAGYEVIVISNQQGIAKKVISESDLRQITQAIETSVQKAGGSIKAFYYCKHLSSDNCPCRKPKPGLILQAADDFNIKLNECWFIGDTERDMQAAVSAGCKPILVLSGHSTRELAEQFTTKPLHIADNLSEAVDIILNQ